MGSTIPPRLTARPPSGTRSRSAIFYHNEEQKDIAEKLIRDLEVQNILDRPIVTEVAPLDKFFVAEDYHQEYFASNPFQPYCMAVVARRSKFRKHYQDLLKKEAV